MKVGPLLFLHVKKLHAKVSRIRLVRQALANH